MREISSCISGLRHEELYDPEWVNIYNYKIPYPNVFITCKDDTKLYLTNSKIGDDEWKKQ